MSDAAKAVLLDKVTRAICAERCAFYGDPPCWRLEGEFPPTACDEPGCQAFAMAAIAAMKGGADG